jgi:hypothetical protein
MSGFGVVRAFHVEFQSACMDCNRVWRISSIQYHTSSSAVERVAQVAHVRSRICQISGERAMCTIPLSVGCAHRPCPSLEEVESDLRVEASILTSTVCICLSATVA